MQTCSGFFLKSLLESLGNYLEICSVKFVDTLSCYYFTTNTISTTTATTMSKSSSNGGGGSDVTATTTSDVCFASQFSQSYFGLCQILQK